ncbi:MAG: hypothetical protein P8Z70_13055, partial [Desulfuromonadales bacterium]
PLANSYPWTKLTLPTLQRLAILEPKLLAVMHGSCFTGDGGSVLRGLAGMMKDVLDPGEEWEEVRPARWELREPPARR